MRNAVRWHRDWTGLTGVALHHLQNQPSTRVPCLWPTQIGCACLWPDEIDFDLGKRRKLLIYIWPGLAGSAS